MVEYSVTVGHCILLNNNSILTKKSRHRDQLIMEEMETDRHPNNVNMEVGFSLSRLWKPVIPSAKERKKKAFSKHKLVTYSLNDATLPRLLKKGPTSHFPLPNHREPEKGGLFTVLNFKISLQ